MAATIRNGWALDVRESIIPGRCMWTWECERERYGELASGHTEGDEAAAIAHANAVMDLIQSGVSYREVMAAIRGYNLPADDTREADVMIARENRIRGI